MAAFRAGVAGRAIDDSPAAEQVRHEYFHGDTGMGIGASHQTGWTGLVAHLLCQGGVLDRVAREGRESAMGDLDDVAPIADAEPAGPAGR